MFLGVSGIVPDVDIQKELTDVEREVVADRLLAEQRDRFDGVQKAAYTEAQVNPATWARATGALRVRPDRLVKIVKQLWPQSGGDWDEVPSSLAEQRQADLDRVALRSPAESAYWTRPQGDEADEPVTWGHMEDRLREVEDRIARLERSALRIIAELEEQRQEEGGGEHDRGSAATNDPSAGPGNAQVRDLPAGKPPLYSFEDDEDEEDEVRGAARDEDREPPRLGDE